MKGYKGIVKEFLADYTSELRKEKGWTQEEMAEQLRITNRAYGDLERGKYCFSSVALLFLMSILKDHEQVKLIDEFRKKVQEIEQKEVA